MDSQDQISILDGNIYKRNNQGLDRNI